MPAYHQPHPWNPGYAVPKYVQAEPPGRGTFTTKWLPRKTISEVVPDFLAKPGKELLGRNDAGLGSLSEDSLGCASPRGTLSGNSLGVDYVMQPGGRLEVGPDGKLYETLGDIDLSSPVVLAGAAFAAWWLFMRKKPRKNPSRRRKRPVARRRRRR